MNLEQWYSIQPNDWKELEKHFRDSYYPVHNFITENKGSFSEAREVYIEAFYYYTRSIELKGKSYLEKAEGLIYSFARIIWLKKLAKRNVDTGLVHHKREFYDLDATFHEIDLMAERCTKASMLIAEIGEPCRTLILEVIGKGNSLEEVGSRLGFTIESRAQARLTSCMRKLTKLLENKAFTDKDDHFKFCLRYILDPTSVEKPGGKRAEVCLAITSRVVATIRNHVNGSERTAALREFRDRLIPEDTKLIKMIDSESKRKNMKPVQLISIAAFIALMVSGITTFSVNQFSIDVKKHFLAEDTVSYISNEIQQDTLEYDTLIQVPEITWLERSAFLVSNDGIALTTSQGLSEGQKIDVSKSENESAQAEVIAVDEELGIALLHVDTSMHVDVPFILSEANPVIGEELFSLGFSNHNDLFYSEAHTQRLEDENQWISSNSLDQGAPLLSFRGELKAMVSSNEADQRSVGVNQLKKFIRTNASKTEFPDENLLRYKKNSKKIEMVSPCVLKIKFKA